MLELTKVRNLVSHLVVTGHLPAFTVDLFFFVGRGLSYADALSVTVPEGIGRL